MSSPGQDTPKNPRITISPTTSTPGMSPEGSQSNGLRSSELLHSDESLVDISTDKLTVIESENTMEVTLSEKSVEKTNTLDIYDVSCVTLREHTITQDNSEMSCVALRTRSRMAEIRKLNLSQLFAELSMDDTVDDYEIVTSNAVDSLTLPRYNKESLKILYDTLKSIDTSMDNISILDETVKQEDIVMLYSNKAADMIERGKSIQPLQDVADDGLVKEIEEIRDSTFIIERPQYESALVEVIKALETLVNMDLSITPTKQMESILRVILAICIDYHTKIQSLHDTMITMARFIRELLVLGCKLEITDKNSRRLEEEKQKLGSDINALRSQLVSTNQFLNRQITVGPKTGSEIAEEIVNLETKVKTLEEKAVVQDGKLKEMWEYKENHKMRAIEGHTNLNNTIRNITAERDRYKDERERDTVIKQNLQDDNAVLADKLLEANEVIKEKVENINKMKKKHVIEKENMLENYEAQSCIDNGKLKSQDIQIMQMEEMKKKATNFFNKRMKEENGLRTKAEKALSDNKEVLKVQAKKIKKQSKEIYVWRKMCRLFWKQDPNEIYNPNAPPSSVETDTNEEDSTASIEFVDTSTAGIYGDTEDHLDQTLPQERDPLERDPSPCPEIPERDPSPLPQREVKRRKLSDRKTEKEKENNSSSADSIKSDHSREERKERSCRTKLKHNNEIQEEVKTLKDQSQKDRTEVENLRKEVEKLNIALKEKDQEISKKAVNKKAIKEENSETQTEKQICKIAETQTFTAQKTGQTQTSEIGSTSEIGDDQENTQVKTQASQIGATSTSKVGDAQNSQIGDIQVQQVTSQIGANPKAGNVSQELKGLIINPDGTFTMTKQFMTWVKNPEVQLEDTYPHPMGFPKEPVLDKSWHPAPSNLKLGHSFQGEWARLCVDRYDNTGPLYKNYHIVRVEKYIGEDGVIRKAVCYQKEASALYIWFRYEDILETFTNWVTPTPSYYFNGRKWNAEMRKEYAHLEKNATGYTRKNINNSNKDRQTEDWSKKTDEDSQSNNSGAGRGYRYRRDESARRAPRDQSRDMSRERYRHRRHSDRSSSPDRRRNFDDDRDRKTSYGKGRY